MTQWYHAQGGQRFGPMSFDDLKRLAAEGKLQAGDLVFQTGTTSWVSASTVPGLFEQPAVNVAEVEPLPEDEPPPVPEDSAREELPLPLRLWHSLSWHVNRMPISRLEE